MADFQFTVDKAHAKSVNDTLADVRRLQISAVIFAIVLAAVGAWLISMGEVWSIIIGAVLAIGAAVGGLAGAVWADRNGDGRADGYTYNGQYYEGQPTNAQMARATVPSETPWPSPSCAGSASASNLSDQPSPKPYDRLPPHRRSSPGRC